MPIATALLLMLNASRKVMVFRQTITPHKMKNSPANWHSFLAYKTASGFHFCLNCRRQTQQEDLERYGVSLDGLWAIRTEHLNAMTQCRTIMNSTRASEKKCFHQLSRWTFWCAGWIAAPGWKQTCHNIISKIFSSFSWDWATESLIDDFLKMFLLALLWFLNSDFFEQK